MKFLLWLFILCGSVLSIPIDNGLVLKRRPVPNQDAGKLDVIFVIDGSTSIGDENFEFLRQFLVQLVGEFSDEIKVAAIQFSGGLRIEFNFKKFDKIADVKDYFSTMSYLKGTTRIGYALNQAVEKLLPATSGNRPDVKDIVVVITDGRSSDDPAPPAKILRRKGAQTVAIGVTDFVDEEQIVAIGGSPESVFRVKEFSKLDQTLRDTIVAQSVCTYVTKPPQLGEPSVDIECGPDNIKIGSETKNEFEGNVYVKGRSNDPNCRQTGNGDKYAQLAIPFSDCGTLRRRSVNPRGIFVESTVIFKFHPLVLTKVDRAFKIQCFYMEADKTVSSELDVSMLTTSAINEQFPMPTCQYTIRAESPTGPPIRFAVIGQKVFHRWECDNSQSETLFKMRVHSCFVNDGNGDKISLLDEDGCSLDEFVMRDLTYHSTDMLATVETHVFKYRDRPHLYFQCQISLCVDLEGGCQDTPPTCPIIRFKRSAVQATDREDMQIDVATEFLSVVNGVDVDVDVESNFNIRTGKIVSSNESKMAAPREMCLTHLEFFLLTALTFGSFVLMTAMNVAVHLRSTHGKDRKVYFDFR